MINSILDIPDLLIKKGLPFAIYSLPESNKCRLIFQKDQFVNHIEILDVEDVSGFIIADFDSAKTGIANLIKPDFILSEGENTDEVVKFLNSLPDIGNYNCLANTSISKHRYLEIANYLIGNLKEGKIEKVVLSRLIEHKLKNKLIPARLIELLKEKYNDAFVYFFHLPNTGTWCGASPETLFKVVDSNILVDALAGTRLASENNGSPRWSLKEKEEQYFVTLFIESLLSELGIDDFKKSDPVSITAGKLAHIQTKFIIPVSSVVSKTGKLIAGLHPTPAVCGLPKAEAFLLIQKAEHHERRFYTGFIGPWKMEDESQLFVNLRCAELGADKINIYVGGGLTASSDPEAEYQETVHKSQTLLSVVEKL